MGYPTYTVSDLSLFTGRPVASFAEPFTSGSAIPQATLLFKIGTCLASIEELTPEEQNLAKFAILSMADAITLSQPYQGVLANPFASETIGSYSYSKVSGAILAGVPTGISWFDVAIQELSVCDRDGSAGSTFASGGIEVFDYDGVFRPGIHQGNVDFLSPDDLNKHEYWYRTVNSDRG